MAEDQPYCMDHFYETTAHKCQACGNYITGPTMVSAVEQRVCVCVLYTVHGQYSGVENVCVVYCPWSVQWSRECVCCILSMVSAVE